MTYRIEKIILPRTIKLDDTSNIMIIPYSELLERPTADSPQHAALCVSGFSLDINLIDQLSFLKIFDLHVYRFLWS
jgi:hypothetical protein